MGPRVKRNTNVRKAGNSANYAKFQIDTHNSNWGPHSSLLTILGLFWAPRKLKNLKWSGQPSGDWVGLKIVRNGRQGWKEAVVGLAG